MAHNIHLEDLEHVTLLAQQKAQATKEDQAIFKTKDQYKYEIFAFVPAYRFSGTAVRVVRYTGNDYDQDVLQSVGNEQPVTVGKKPKSGKGKPHGTTEPDMDRTTGFLLQEHEPSGVGELPSQPAECGEDTE